MLPSLIMPPLGAGISPISPTFLTAGYTSATNHPSVPYVKFAKLQNFPPLSPHQPQPTSPSRNLNREHGRQLAAPGHSLISSSNLAHVEEQTNQKSLPVSAALDHPTMKEAVRFVNGTSISVVVGNSYVFADEDFALCVCVCGVGFWGGVLIEAMG